MPHMKYALVAKGYVPLDKSWMIRMGVLDILDGNEESIKFLKQHYEELSDDLKALYRSSLQWRNGDVVDVGESGTLYRFLQFAAWKRQLKKTFVRQGTLLQRELCTDQSIVDRSLDDLLKLDNGTSQWASAAILSGNRERVENPPYKLKLTYDAVEHWFSKKASGERWEARYDATILEQAAAYIQLRNNQTPGFVPQQSEDYCFARAFGLISQKEGELRWPSLRGHESNRIIEMETAIKCAEAGEEVDSKDHRVVQAVAMLQKVKNKPIKIKNPSVVSKSWPQFWRFLEDYQWIERWLATKPS